MTKTFLDKAYSVRDADATRALYDDWSDSYDAEVGGRGYATPARCAQALAQFCTDLKAPLLDFGCGTGLSGQALNAAGFETIDGVDLSSEMLSHAQSKALYRDLRQIEPGVPLAHTPGSYAAIAAIGVIGAGAAPIDTFDLVMHGLAPGGMFVLSFNDHSLEDPQNEARLNEWIDGGAARLLLREYGDHLPGLDMKSMVYVIEKA